MAGHSQFANIKHRKDAQDSKRGKIFKKISREIYVAVKSGGVDTKSNPKLRVILEKARSLNMPKDNIARAIAKGSNQQDTDNYEEVVYEGYGPFASAFIVHCLTDNKNRTASNVRSYFTKCEGKLGTSNSVQYLFQKIGLLIFETTLSEDELLQMTIDFDVLNITKEENIATIEVAVESLSSITKWLENNGIKEFITNEVRNISLDKVTINDSEAVKQITKLLALLEDDDDVQFVENNLT